MIKKENLFTKSFIHIATIALVILILLISIFGIFTYRQTRETIKDNVSTRAFSEMNEIAEEQKALINSRITEQFNPLIFLRSYLESGGSFGDKTFKGIAQSLVETNDLCTIGMADLSGNAFSYDGEKIGNIYEREYFKNVIEKKTDTYVEYLPETTLLPEHRFVFSVPIYQNDELTGILFASKEPELLAEILLGKTDTMGIKILLFDAKGTLFVQNQSSNNYLLGSNIYGKGNFEFISDSNEGKKALKDLESGKSGDYIYKDKESEKYVVYSNLDINDCNLFLMAERNQLELKFEKNMDGVKSLVFKMMLALGIVIIISFILVAALIIEWKKLVEERDAEKERYICIFKELGCELIEYDTATDEITINDSLNSIFCSEIPNTLTEAISYGENLYPESNFKRVKSAVNNAIIKKEPVIIEIPLFQDKKSKWYSFTLIPLLSDIHKVNTVLVSIQDVSHIHAKFKDSAAMLALLPGGVHRCYLSDPAHVEYISEGLCRMLGYTEEELNELIKGDYSLIISPDDRQKFEDFVYQLSLEPAVETCDYAMVRKDGQLIYVSDTMESIRASSGIMYGYSTVVNTSKKREELLSAYTAIEEGKNREASLKREQKRLELEMELLQIKSSISQMQPHFLYNALASIREIILVDPEYASDLICDFTTHLRACVRLMSDNALISFGQEIENVKAYVNIEKIRFGDKLTVEYKIENDDFMIVPLSIQPLVENSIRHGIYPLGSKGGKVCISSIKEGNVHIVTIEDNGVGFDYKSIQEEIESGKRDSTGLKNLIFRLEKGLGAKVSINSAVGVGTTIRIEIPDVKE